MSMRGTLSPGFLNTRAGLAKFVDHTLLGPIASPADIDRLCDEATKYRFWSVCVSPVNVKRAAIRLRGSSVKVCTVIGFPLGYNARGVKLDEAMRAVEDGADEIDMVQDIGALKSGDVDAVFKEISEVSAFCKRSGRLLKVIIECCYLTDDEKVRAAKLAESAGAEFVKTSTGFGPGGATAADVALLRRSLNKRTKIKAAGGIRTLAQALEMIKAGADRIGTSSGAKIMEELPP